MNKATFLAFRSQLLLPFGCQFPFYCECFLGVFFSFFPPTQRIKQCSLASVVICLSLSVANFLCDQPFRFHSEKEKMLLTIRRQLFLPFCPQFPITLQVPFPCILSHFRIHTVNETLFLSFCQQLLLLFSLIFFLISRAFPSCSLAF